MLSQSIFLFVLFACLLVKQSIAGGAGESHPWEFAGYVDLHESAEHGNYTLSFSKAAATETKPAEYADPAMTMYVHTSSSVKDADLEALESTAKAAFNTNATQVYSGATLSTGVYYSVNFDTDSFTTDFKLNVATDGNQIFYAQHFPSEFSMTITDSAGKTYELTQIKEESTPTGSNAGVAWASCFIVNLCTLFGVCFVGYFTMKGEKVREALEADNGFIRKLSLAFGGGALASVAFILMFPEAVRIVGASFKSSEADANTMLGVFTLLGVIATLGVDAITEVMFGEGEEEPKKDLENAAGEEERAWYAFTPAKWTGTAYGVLLGDFLHNLVDGVVIVLAFNSCSSARGWAVVAGVIAHELAQEIADFFVLITKGRMQIFEALVMNFLSGISVYIGAGVATSGGLKGATEGYFLALSAGIYLTIALASCISEFMRVEGRRTTGKEYFLFFIVLIAAMVIIGAVARLHSHGCGGEGGHEHAH